MIRKPNELFTKSVNPKFNSVNRIPIKYVELGCHIRIVFGSLHDVAVSCLRFHGTPPTFLIWNNLCDLVYQDEDTAVWWCRQLPWKHPHLLMTEPRRGECRPPVNKSTCRACSGALKAIPGYSTRFLATQLVHICLASYRGHLSGSVFHEWAFCVEVDRGNGNVRSRTSHTMMLMVLVHQTPASHAL